MRINVFVLVNLCKEFLFVFGQPCGQLQGYKIPVMHLTSLKMAT